MKPFEPATSTSQPEPGDPQASNFIVQREVAAKLNPFISSIDDATDTLQTVSHAMRDLGYAISIGNGDETEGLRLQFYLIMGTLCAAIDYEILAIGQGR
jgi:hypothetical protein